MVSTPKSHDLTPDEIRTHWLDCLERELSANPPREPWPSHVVVRALLCEADCGYCDTRGVYAELIAHAQDLWARHGGTWNDDDSRQRVGGAALTSN